MKRVTIIGGGFSGLPTAYFLARDGVPVTLLERQDRVGGFLDTLATPHGLVETAASGIRNTGRLEQLCAELDTPLVGTKKESRRRYLFRDGDPRQGPRGIGESIGMAARLAGQLVTGHFRPFSGETIETWGRRVIGGPATSKILGAALQGIYAGDPARMSASLIMGKRQKPPKPEKKGLVAPPRGLAQLVTALETKLVALGAEIQTGTTVDSLPDGPVVISTSARDASRLLEDRSPQLANTLQSVEMIPLMRVTAFFPRSENTIPGFGVLFPREEGVRALGVLFNSNIFPDRSEGQSESWIYGGATDREILDLDDDALGEILARDRETLFGRRSEPIDWHAQRWHVGLPHYTLGLEATLRNGIEPPNGIHLTGNYLRGIGLPYLLEQSFSVAEKIKATA